VVTATSQLTVSGTITGGSIRTTSTSTPPSNPTVGDIWYNTTDDTIYRYTTDGTTGVWLDYTGPSVGNAVNGTNVTASLIPTANISYDLGSPTNRFRTLYVSSSTIDIGGVPLSVSNGALQVNGAPVGGMPKVTAIYPANSSYTTSTALAVLPNSTGYVVISGSGFVSGATVYINTASAITATVVSSNIINAQVPALSTGTYIVYVSNPDGGSTQRLPGLQYSIAPVWTATTSSFSLPVIGGSYQFTAVSDSPVTYAITSGTLFSGFTLNASTGVISGSGTYTSTNVTIQITATDQEQQTVSQTATISLTSNYTINYLVVAGGGGGGEGGGGAGGLLTGTTSTQNGNTFTVTVGSGGSGTATSLTGSAGSNSSVFGSTAIGGGGGSGDGGSKATAGGSGGGGGAYTSASSGASGTPGQGNTGGGNGGYTGPGWPAGGGGGAGATGSNGTLSTGGAGGAGTTFAYINTATAALLGVGQVVTATNSVYFAGGGGGGSGGGASGGAGGIGGGGSGWSSGSNGNSGIAFTGGGGGGGNFPGNSGGNGGYGVVIISYQSSSQRGTGGIVASYISSGTTYWVHAFTATGTYTA